MLSATTAESRLSIAASIATVNAEGSSGRIKSTRNSGSEIAGSPVGMPPNLLPIVSTGTPTKTQASVVANERDDRAGHFLRHPRPEQDDRQRRHGETTTAGMLNVAALFASAIIRGTNSLGT